MADNTEKKSLSARVYSIIVILSTITTLICNLVFLWRSNDSFDLRSIISVLTDSYELIMGQLLLCAIIILAGVYIMINWRTTKYRLAFAILIVLCLGGQVFLFLKTVSVRPEHVFSVFKDDLERTVRAVQSTFAGEDMVDTRKHLAQNKHIDSFSKRNFIDAEKLCNTFRGIIFLEMARNTKRATVAYNLIDNFYSEFSLFQKIDTAVSDEGLTWTQQIELKTRMENAKRAADALKTSLRLDAPQFEVKAYVWNRDSKIERAFSNGDTLRRSVDGIRFTISSKYPCYFYLYYLEGENLFSCLFPLQIHQEAANYYRGDGVFTLPPPESQLFGPQNSTPQFDPLIVTFDGPAKDGTIYLLATYEPIPNLRSFTRSMCDSSGIDQARPHHSVSLDQSVIINEYEIVDVSILKQLLRDNFIVLREMKIHLEN